MSRRAEDAHRVLVLQGGGALGSYQGGVYEALAEVGELPEWIAGISIGAINAALIAGNPPERRLERMKMFWERVTSGVTGNPWMPGDDARSMFNNLSALYTAGTGIPGFFKPRFPPAFLFPPGSREAMSMYDTAPLKQTLLELVDFDLINSKEIRLSVGAVNVCTGNFTYFDNFHRKIVPEHIMASGALPPGFPPVEIEGQFYWDGGLVSNTPLQYVLDEDHVDDLTIYQVDLFSAEGKLPRNLVEAQEREKDIRFSSRTRMNTDQNLRLRQARTALSNLMKKLPAEFANDDDVKLLAKLHHETAVTVVQLIYRDKAYEGGTKDYEFSRATMTEHWESGLHDARRTMRHRSEIKRRASPGGAKTFDIHHHS